MTNISLTKEQSNINIDVVEVIVRGDNVSFPVKGEASNLSLIRLNCLNLYNINLNIIKDNRDIDKDNRDRTRVILPIPLRRIYS